MSIEINAALLENLPKVVYALDFCFWKKSSVRNFFQHSQVKFVESLNQVPEFSTLAVWGNMAFDSQVLADKKITLLRVEDGFLRSVGLGVDLIQPVSWVIDSRGIYYDATKISDLEYLLQTADFSAELLERGKALRERIVKHELTKYNVGNNSTKNTIDTIKNLAAGRKIILVPGQVEKDASLAFGASIIRQNIELLRAVRATHPEAHLIYKPHPDVASGIRVKGEGEEQAQNYCDSYITDCAMGELLLHVDEVHTLTSLTGFEALLRGKKVTCYGLPFYAGWGLTEDIVSIERRTRQLTLDELVVATLILYPTYVSQVSELYITAEQALDELLAWRSNNASKLVHWHKVFRPFRRVLRPLLSAIGMKE